LDVETFVWSRGYRRYIADQVDHDNHLQQGRVLAAQIGAYRAAYPANKIYLVGHSAGCAVVLHAAELQPPDSIDRIILLAPSVCATYDLRPALRAARCGIDVFHSEEDRWVLGLGVRIVGTAERQCRTAAGQTGFTPVIELPADAALYERLRQHPWNSAVEWSGHDGGHYGNHEAGFLRAYVLPLLQA
jgi:pimeloyl-ACP methyl ester carboxylesterase